MDAKNFNEKLMIDLPLSTVGSLVASIIIAVCTYIWGLNNGREDGYKAAYAAAISRAFLSTEALAEAAAMRAGDAVTEKAIKEMVEQTYQQQLKEHERIGFEKCVAGSQSATDLQQYYKLFSETVQEGAKAAANGKEEKAIRLAVVIIETKRIALQTMTDISHDVLNGQVDELSDALKKRDKKKVLDILLRIHGTLAARDIRFRQIFEKLQGESYALDKQLR